MDDPNQGLNPQNRPLTAKERDLIEWLLRHGNPGSDEWLSQLDTLTVTWRCSCGCPTIYFDLRATPVGCEPEIILADFLATVEGDAVGVILFRTGGRLSSLEVYSLGGTDEPFGLPGIEALRPY
jgi:hypothetical protein